MYTKWLMSLCGLLMVLMHLLTASQASAQALHGTDGEKQVMGEMKTKLGKALTTGDVSACQREGENLASYGIGAQGEALIARDIASVQRKLDAVKLVYKSHYDLRTLNNKKSVKQAFKLISKLQDKLTEDVLDEVSMLFVPAHSVSSKIALELYKATKDVYGNNSDAGELLDSAKALKELDRLVKNSDEKMKKMIPEAKNLERVRTFLINCHTAFIEAEHTTTKRPSSSFSGTWVGTYNNSRNEPGSSVTTLVETGSTVHGTDDGLTILDGRRSGSTMTWRLEKGGGFSRGGATWNMTVQILDNGNTLVERYTARDHRKDKNDGGSYSGVATLHRK